MIRILFFLFIPFSIFSKTETLIEIKEWYYSFQNVDEPWASTIEWKDWSIDEIQKDKRVTKLNTVWLKAKLPGEEFINPTLYFDSIDLNFEVYIKNQKIYQYGKTKSTGEVIFNGWPVHIIQLDKNYPLQEIYLKVSSISNYPDIGIWKLRFIGELSSIYKFIFLNSLIVIFISFLFFFSFFLSFIFYCTRVELRFILYFSIISLLMGFFIFFSPYNQLKYLYSSNSFLFFILEFFSEYFLLPFFGLFLLSLFDFEKYLEKMIKIVMYLSFLSTGIAFIFILYDRNSFYILHFYMNLLIFAGIFLYFIAVSYLVFKSNRDAIYLYLGLIIFFLSSIIDLSNFFNLFDSISTLHIGFIFLMISLVIIITKKYWLTYEELYKKNLELEQQKSQIIKLNTMKNSFLIQMSNRIAKPLNDILYIIQQQKIFDEYHEYFSRIIEDFKREILRVKNLLSLEYEQFSVQKEIIDLVDFFKVLLPIPENKKIELQIESLSEEIRIHFNIQLFIDILNDLFFYSGNEIQIQIFERQSSVEIQIVSNNNLLLPEIENFFEPYLKLDLLDSTFLYLTKKYLEYFEHHFNYKITNHKIIYTLIFSKSIHFPEEKNEYKKQIFYLGGNQSIYSTKSQREDSPRILVLYDNQFIIQQILKMTKDKYFVFSTNNLEIAEFELSKNRYDILILPPFLYGKSILSFYKKIRNIYEQFSLFVILIQPFEYTKIEIFLQMGIDDFIFLRENQIREEELLLKIKKNLIMKELISRYLIYQQYKVDIQTLGLLQENLQLDFNTLKRDLDFDVKYISAEQISGDIYDIFQKSENEYVVILADVTGHGLYSAFFSLVLKLFFRYLYKNLNNSNEILQTINEIIISYFNKQLVSCIILNIHIKKREIEIYKAGHPPPIFYSNKNHSYKILELKGRILGVSKNEVYIPYKFQYEPNDRIFLYTDGLVEIDYQDKTLELFDLLKRINHSEKNITEISELVFKNFLNQNLKGNIKDDISYIFINFK